ncbi:hypothetical protein BHE74_00023612 [Ensete ventricosum]|nr:hypothetical protein BHE74_00023612 [Ensete ventricosum]
MSSSEEHSYTCFAKVGCRASCKYSLDNGPSVQNGLDLEMVDHLDTKGSSPSMHFSHVMIEVKYQSTPARSSISHSSLMGYPRSGNSSKASGSCLATAFRRHFLKPASAPELGHFSTMDTLASPTASMLATDGAVESLPAPPPDFILLRLNISAQQKSSCLTSKRSTRRTGKRHKDTPPTEGYEKTSDLLEKLSEEKGKGMKVDDVGVASAGDDEETTQQQGRSVQSKRRLQNNKGRGTNTSPQRPLALCLPQKSGIAHHDASRFMPDELPCGTCVTPRVILINKQIFLNPKKNTHDLQQASS